VVHKFGVQLQLLQLGFWSLVMVWTFCLGYGLDSLLGALALERSMLPWLAIGSKGLLLELFYLSRLRCLGVDLAYGWVTILLYCLWKNEHISLFLTKPW
jgi:hypothetical protein